MNKRCNFIMLLLLLGNSMVWGQSEVEYKSLLKANLVASPEMASLVQNIVYPIDYSTGTVNVSIPLYEIKCGDIKLPISLSYHTSGVKLNTRSGWVGQGWTLICEPTISRNIQGLDDLRYKYDFVDFPDEWHKRQMIDGAIDEQPDEYYYYLPNNQGMFMNVLKPKVGKPRFMSQPFRNIKIDLSGSAFTIKDDKGIVCYFDSVYEMGGSPYSILGWKANSVVSSNKEGRIDFTYFQSSETSVDYRDCIVVLDQFSRHFEYNKSRSAWEGNIDYSTPNYNAMFPLRDYWMQSPVIYSGVYSPKGNTLTYNSYQCNGQGVLYRDWCIDNLQFYDKCNTISQRLESISFTGGSIEFKHCKYKGSSNDVLTDIIVYNNLHNVVKHIKFTYDFVKSQNRYYLKELCFTGKEGKKKEIYAFDYWNKYLLPPLGSKSIDLWGYYNGTHREDTVSLVPHMKIEASRETFNQREGSMELYIGADISRESNEKYMYYGALKSITYPVGSMDMFEYEGNKCRDNNRGVRTVGGLRIKSIVSSHDSKITNKRYLKYGEKESGEGYARISSNPEHFMLLQEKDYIEPIVADCNASTGNWTIQPLANTIIKARMRTYFSSPIISNTFNGGSAVMYDYVTEYNGTPDCNLGKTVYHYSVDTDTLDAPIINTARQKRYDHWQYGKLLGKQVYKFKDGKYVLAEEIFNIYDAMSKKYGTICVGEANRTIVPEGKEFGYEDIYYTIDLLRSYPAIGANVLVRSTKSVYDDNGRYNYVSNQYDYCNSDSVLLMKKKSESTSRYSYDTEYEYPGDYSNDPIYKKMAIDNFLPVVSTIYTRNGRKIKRKNDYANLKGVYLPVIDKIEYSSDADWKERNLYKYDDWGNIVEATKDNKEKVVYLYGYNHQYIVAVIENATYQEVADAIQGGSQTIVNIAKANDMTAWMGVISQLRSSMSYAHITSYTYEPLVGVSSITKPNGEIIYYEYDELGRLLHVYQKDKEVIEHLQRYEYNYKTKEVFV